MLNEYIIDKFSCEIEQKKDRYFFDEIEYILYGKESQNENLKNVKISLLLLRAALNYISIHLDREKTALARSVGTAVSLLTFGIGGGVISELIITSWALFEAYNDVDKLLSGEKIAIIKAKGDYSIDFSMSNGQKSPITADYTDYLRLFLLFESETVKLGRIKNLIFLNTGLDPSLMFVSLRGGYMDEFHIEKGY